MGNERQRYDFAGQRCRVSQWWIAPSLINGRRTFNGATFPGPKPPMYRKENNSPITWEMEQRRG